MKFGIRVPSLKKRISARISPKRYIRHSLGVKMPRGLGVLTNPKKALYNKVYNKTSVSVDRLAKMGTKKRLKKSSSSSDGSFLNREVDGSIWGYIFSILFLFIYWPIGLGLLAYFLYKSLNKSKNATINSNGGKELQDYASKSLERPDILFNIPEPTISLLWVTNEDTDKIGVTHTITIEIGSDGVNAKDPGEDNFNFYAEPSLIWTRLPIESNPELEKEKMYYPSYSQLTPKQRYQYLKWLEDITQETNLSYAFLYLYGLERQLLTGDFDKAAKEILRLVKHHSKGTFKIYAVSGLVAASVLRQRSDVLDMADFPKDELTDTILALRVLRKESLNASKLMEMSSRFGFSNKRYINMHPDLFKEKLKYVISEYEQSNGNMFDSVDYASLPKEQTVLFANYSLPDEVRCVEFPQVLKDQQFKTLGFDLLSRAHDLVKEEKHKK